MVTTLFICLTLGFLAFVPLVVAPLWAFELYRAGQHQRAATVVVVALGLSFCFWLATRHTENIWRMESMCLETSAYDHRTMPACEVMP